MKRKEKLQNISTGLALSHKLLTSAFPEEIPAEYYSAVVAILASEASIDNATKILENYFGMTPEEHHFERDVSIALFKQHKLDPKREQKMQEVIEILKPFGYEEWLHEDDNIGNIKET